MSLSHIKVGVEEQCHIIDGYPLGDKSLRGKEVIDHVIKNILYLTTAQRVIFLKILIREPVIEIV